MKSFAIAHIKEQGIDLIIVPLESSFGLQAVGEQHRAIAALQQCAAHAGLAGTVVPVWQDLLGRMAFIAPPEWHPYFTSISLEFVSANLNRTLMCGL